MSAKAPYAMEFARIAVPDLEDSVSFYDYHVGLEVSESLEGRTYMRAGTEHHCLELLPSPGAEQAEVQAIGYSVESGDVLESLEERARQAGLEIHPVDKSLTELITEGFGVDDPNGLRVELFTDFAVFAEPPFRLYRPSQLVHPFLATAEYEETVRFYTEVLAFRPSDYIRDSVAFLRSEDRYHHSLAVRRADEFEVEHLCFIMQSLDHVMRGRARALYKEITIPSDLVNHSGSRSIAFYMHEPVHGPRIELCDGHIRFTEEEHETHRPRHMSVDPRNIDVWRPAGDDWARF